MRANMRGTDWDEDSPIQSTDVNLLASELRQIALNPWRSVNIFDGASIKCASDSSDHYGGYVIFNALGEVTHMLTII